MANNITIYDKDRVAKIMETTESPGGVHRPHHNAHITEIAATFKDAFGRLRASLPGYRYESQLTNQVDPDLWDVVGIGSTSSTYSSINRMVTLQADALGANTRVMQSHYHAPYTAGRGQLAFVTFVPGATPTTEGRWRAGYFDGINGAYVEQNSTDIRVGILSSTTAGNESYAKGNWNIDNLDGSGPSGHTLDLTKTQIFLVQMQALYVGAVVVGFDIDGDIVPVHMFKHANLIAYPYIAQASLPIRYEVTATANTPDPVTLSPICSTVISEGGDDLMKMSGRPFSASNGATSIAVTTRRPILSIQANQQLNSINQNAVVLPKSINVLARTNDAFIEIVYNGTLTNASFAAVNAASSVMSRDVAATAISGGTVIDSFFVPASNTVRNAADKSILGKVLLAYSHLLGVGDRLTIVATSRTGTSDIHGAMSWEEIR